MLVTLNQLLHLLPQQNKEVAVDIERLPEGTVIFEDIAVEPVKGKILKMIKASNRRPSEALAGRIMYETPKGYVVLWWSHKTYETSKRYVVLVWTDKINETSKGYAVLQWTCHIHEDNVWFGVT